MAAVTSRDSEYSSSQFPCAAGGQGLCLTHSGQFKTLPIFPEIRDSGTFWITDCFENRMTAMNPLVQGSTLVRSEVRQEMREGNMQAALYPDCCFWEGCHIMGRVFLSDRAPQQHLPVMGHGRGHRGRSPHCSAQSFFGNSAGRFGNALLARRSPLWVHTLLQPPGKKQAERRGEVLLGSLLPSPFSDSLLLNYFFPSNTVNLLLLFSKLI